MSELNNAVKDQQDSPLIQAIKRNPCEKCRKFKIPVCKCRGGGGGGGSGGGSSESTDNKNTQQSGTNQVVSGLENTASFTRVNDEDIKIIFSQLDAGMKIKNERMFDFNAIENLIRLGVLSIENNSQSGTLSIKWIPGLSKDQAQTIQDFLNFIAFTLDNFKKELGLSDDIKPIMTNHSFTINIPNPKLYDQFIQKLILMLEFENKRQQENTLISTHSNKSDDAVDHVLEQKDKKRFNPIPRPKGFVTS